MCCFPSIPHPAKLKLFFERVVWLISCHSDSTLSYIFISSFHSCVNQMISLISTMVPPGHLSWHSSHWACRPSHQWGDWGWSKWENGHLWYFLWYRWSMIKNDFWFDFFINPISWLLTKTYNILWQNVDLLLGCHTNLQQMTFYVFGF